MVARVPLYQHHGLFLAGGLFYLTCRRVQDLFGLPRPCMLGGRLYSQKLKSRRELEGVPRGGG